MVLRLLWIAAVGFQVIAAIRFFPLGLVRRFPLICLWLLASALRSTFLLTSATTAEYVQIYSSTAPIMRALTAVCVIELFTAATSEYRHFTRIGQAILATLAIIGGTLSLANQLLVANNSWWLGASVGFERLVDVIMATVLIGSWAALAHIGRKIPRAATWGTWILGAQLTSGVLLSSMMGIGYRSFTVRVTLPILTSLAASMAWCMVPRWQEGDSPARNESALAAGAAGMDLRESRLRDAVSAVR